METLADSTTPIWRAWLDWTETPEAEAARAGYKNYRESWRAKRDLFRRWYRTIRRPT